MRTYQEKLGLPLDPAQVRRSWNAFQASDKLSRSYVPGTYPGTVTLFRSTEVDTEDAGDLGEDLDLSFREHPTLGWDEHADGPVEVHDVPGDHITMLVEPHVRVLAERLGECLERVE